MKDMTALVLGLGSVLLTVALYFTTKAVTDSSILGYLASMIVPCTLFPLVNKFYPPESTNRKSAKE